MLIEYCFHSHMQKLCILACKFNGMIKTTNIKVPHYFFSAIFVLLFYCLPSSGLLAQVKHIGIQKTRNYSRHDYSGGTQNWGIAQEHLGKMYFANNMGLLEYDGTNWKRYPLNNRSVVRSVASNGHNIIYFGGYNEIGYLSVSETGKEVYTNLTPKVPKEYNNFGEIWRIHLTNYGVIFQSFSTVMLYHNGTIKVLANDYDFQFSFYIDNQLYLSDKKKGLLKFTGKEFIQLSGGDFFKAEKKIWSMFSFGKNNFLIGTQDDGLFLYHKEKTTPWKSEANSFLKKNQLFSAIKLSENNFAFGTIQDGIIITNRQGKILQHFNENTGLANNTVLSLGLDRWNNLWCGLDNGITYIEIHSPVTYLDKGSHINGSGYTSALFNKKLYLGTNQGVYVDDWDESESNLRIGKNFTNIPALNGQVWELKIIGDDLFCGHNKGAYLIEDQHIRQLSDIEGAWNFSIVGEDSSTIISGTYTGMIRFVKKKAGQWNFDKRIAGYQESCRDIIFDKCGYVWVTHGYKGIYRLRLNQEKDSVVQILKYGENHGIHTKTEFYLFSHQNQILFSGYDSIFQYNVLTDQFEYDIYWTDLFQGHGINRFKEDKAGNFWYFGKRENRVGVVLNQPNFKNKANIEILNKLNQRFIRTFEYVHYIDSNNILFGIESGFAHIDPLLANKVKTHFNTIITDIKAIGRRDTLYFDINNNPAQLKKTHVLPPQFKNLRIHFSAAFYENPELTAYRCRLAGFPDSDWTKWNTNTTQEYSNLKFGTYTFYVQAKNVYGEVGEPVSITFHLQKPWYQTNLAYIAYIVILIVLAILIVRYTERKIADERKALEEKQKHKMAEQEKRRKQEAVLFENEIIQLKNEKLQAEVGRKVADVELKNKELASLAIQINHKNEMLTSLKKKLNTVKQRVNEQAQRELSELSNQIDEELELEEDWKKFKIHFDQIQQGFIQKMQNLYPDLKPNDLKLCAFLRMNLSTKEIAPLMNISIRGVEIHRYRLRKKLNLNRETNLVEFLMQQ